MVLPHITPRRVAPYLISGASGVHILVRMWRLNQQPPSDGPVHVFLLKHTDIILVLTGMPVVWHLAQQRDQRAASYAPSAVNTEQSVARQSAHQLRQVFTVLLIGLGIIKRRVIRKQTYTILDVVDRLQNVIAEGIQAVNLLDPPDISDKNGTEWELEA